MLHIFVTLSCFCIIVLKFSAAAEIPTAETINGALTGKFMTSRNGNPYEAFVGIRYGVIPSRFKVHAVSNLQICTIVKTK
jgi:hypothetical protein